VFRWDPVFWALAERAARRDGADGASWAAPTARKQDKAAQRRRRAQEAGAVLAAHAATRASGAGGGGDSQQLLARLGPPQRVPTPVKDAKSAAGASGGSGGSGRRVGAGRALARRASSSTSASAVALEETPDCAAPAASVAAAAAAAAATVSGGGRNGDGGGAPKAVLSGDDLAVLALKVRRRGDGSTTFLAKEPHWVSARADPLLLSPLATHARLFVGERLRDASRWPGRRPSGAQAVVLKVTQSTVPTL
jgi:hypothetical protein